MKHRSDVAIVIVSVGLVAGALLVLNLYFERPVDNLVRPVSNDEMTPEEVVIERGRILEASGTEEDLFLLDVDFDEDTEDTCWATFEDVFSAALVSPHFQPTEENFTNFIVGTGHALSWGMDLLNDEAFYEKLTEALGPTPLPPQVAMWLSENVTSTEKPCPSYVAFGIESEVQFQHLLDTVTSVMWHDTAYSEKTHEEFTRYMQARAMLHAVSVYDHRARGNWTSEDAIAQRRQIEIDFWQRVPFHELPVAGSLDGDSMAAVLLIDHVINDLESEGFWKEEPEDN